jgi:hypothetical protein
MVDVDAPLNGAPGYGVFPTADDRHVAIGIMNEDHFWVGLCRALDLGAHEQLTNNERNRRVRELNADIADAISRLSQSDAPSGSPGTMSPPRPSSPSKRCSSIRTSASGERWSSVPTGDPRPARSSGSSRPPGGRPSVRRPQAQVNPAGCALDDSEAAAYDLGFGESSTQPVSTR